MKEVQNSLLLLLICQHTAWCQTSGTFKYLPICTKHFKIHNDHLNSLLFPVSKQWNVGERVLVCVLSH